VGGDDDGDDKEKEEEAERERQEAIREAEERRKEKHRKMEEEREKMRQEIRDKVREFHECGSGRIMGMYVCSSRLTGRVYVKVYVTSASSDELDGWLINLLRFID
jgi:complexin-1/2